MLTRRGSPSRFDRAASAGLGGLGTAMAVILGQADPVQRSREWLEWVEGIDPAMMAMVVTAFRSGGLEIHQAEYEILLGQWATQNPVEAVEYLSQELPPGSLERSTILTLWARRDFASALSWAERNPSGEDGLNHAILDVAKGVAASQPAMAARLLESQAVIRERPVILGRIIPQILALGPEAAKGWPASFKDPTLRAAAEAEIAAALVREDPEGTVAWIAGMDGPGQERAFDKAVSELARTDTETALGFALGAPPGTARENAFAGVVRSTAMRDLRQAASLIDSHPEVVTDDGIAGLIWYSVQKDPSVGADYLDRIEGDEAFENTLRTLTANWRRRDPAAFEAWLTEHPEYRRP